MAHYFFDLHECGSVIPDHEGLERATLDKARQTAVAAARDIMCAEITQGQLCLSCHIEVKDEDGAVVLMVPFREAVRVTGLA